MSKQIKAEDLLNNNDSIANKKTKELKILFNKYLLFFVGAILIICALPFLFTNFLVSDKVAFNNTGTIGDTIGGIMGPFIAIVASAVTFLAFWQQYKANVILQTQLDKQEDQYKEDIRNREEKEKLDRFENKYYELLRFHRANLDEMKIGSEIVGRNYFKEIYEEFKLCYITCAEISKYHSEEELGKIGCLTTLAYKIIFKGMTFLNKENHNVSELTFYRELRLELSNIQNQFTDYTQRYINQNHSKIVPISKIYNGKTLNFEIKYYPFNGHISESAHYYRHLFHTVKFVVSQDESLINFEAKLDYLRVLRAQLSNHEQTMLYYNAIAEFSQAWFKYEFFTKYKMIHNLPFDLANFGKLPHEHEKIKEGIAFWKHRGAELFENDEG